MHERKALISQHDRQLLDIDLRNISFVSFEATIMKFMEKESNFAHQTLYIILVNFEFEFFLKILVYFDDVLFEK